jgi:hypothetical protein
MMEALDGDATAGTIAETPFHPQGRDDTNDAALPPDGAPDNHVDRATPDADVSMTERGAMGREEQSPAHVLVGDGPSTTTSATAGSGGGESPPGSGIAREEEEGAVDECVQMLAGLDHEPFRILEADELNV